MIATVKRNLRVGFIGAGYISQWHAKAIAGIPGVELAAIADVDIKRAQKFAGEFGLESIYSSVEEFVAESDVDAVHVLTPPDYHENVTLKCIDKGIHVFLEKPMAVTSDQCRAIAVRAKEKSVQVAINHNFLFSRPYLQLREAISRGAIGRITALDIAWNKPLPQLVHGPFNIWMLREPRNLLFELGPHVLSPIVDLLDPVEKITGLVSHPIQLPDKKLAHRNWAFTMRCGNVAVQARMTLGLGMNEFKLHVRGTHGDAVCDFENDTILIDRATHYSLDFDRYHRLRHTAGTLRKQAVRGIGRYVGSKLGFVRNGNPYGESIASSIEAFYGSLATSNNQNATDDARNCESISAEKGYRVMSLCERVWNSVEVDDTLPAESDGIDRLMDESNVVDRLPTPPAHASNRVPRSYLVLGGTGFIGQALVRELLREGCSVRAVVRRPNDVPDDLKHARVELVHGDLQSTESLRRAMEGVDGVFHLARGMGKTWSDYQSLDVEPTIALAKLCAAGHAGRLVYTSSIDSYYAGVRAGVITENTPLDPKIRRRNLYAQSKSAIENELLRMHAEESLDVVITRPGIVLGRGGSPFHWGIGMWNSESVCQVWGSGNNKLPLVLVDDVAKGLVVAMETPQVSGRTFNLVAKPVLSARDYLAELSRTLGAQIEVRPTGIWQFYANDLLKWGVKTAIRHPERRLPSYHDWESRTQQASFDCSITRRHLKWQPIDDADRIIRLGIHEPVAELMA